MESATTAGRPRMRKTVQAGLTTGTTDGLLMTVATVTLVTRAGLRQSRQQRPHSQHRHQLHQHSQRQRHQQLCRAPVATIPTQRCPLQALAQWQGSAGFAGPWTQAETAQRLLINVPMDGHMTTAVTWSQPCRRGANGQI